MDNLERLFRSLPPTYKGIAVQDLEYEVKKDLSAPLMQAGGDRGLISRLFGRLKASTPDPEPYNKIEHQYTEAVHKKEKKRDELCEVLLRLEQLGPHVVVAKTNDRDVVSWFENQFEGLSTTSLKGENFVFASVPPELVSSIRSDLQPYGVQVEDLGKTSSRDFLDKTTKTLERMQL